MALLVSATAQVGNLCKVDEDCTGDTVCDVPPRKSTTAWKTAVDSNNNEVELDDCSIISRKTQMPPHHIETDCQNFCEASGADAGKFDTDEGKEITIETVKYRGNGKCYCYELKTCTEEPKKVDSQESYFVTNGTAFKELDEATGEYIFKVKELRDLDNGKCVYLDPKSCKGKKRNLALSDSDYDLCTRNKTLSNVCIYLALVGYALILCGDYFISKYGLEAKKKAASRNNTINKDGTITKQASVRHVKT